MDNFNWQNGYSQRFGLYHVDFTDPKRPRLPKTSVNFYKQLITDNGFVLGNRETSETKVTPKPQTQRPILNRALSKANSDSFHRIIVLITVFSLFFIHVFH